MAIEKINHVAVMVQDLEKAAKLFSNALGIEFEEPHDAEEANIKNMMSSVGIELVSPLTPDGPAAKSLERRGEGLTTLVLKVNNLEETVARMTANGVRQIGGADLPEAKTAQFHPKDLHGVMIEFIEYK